MEDFYPTMKRVAALMRGGGYVSTSQRSLVAQLQSLLVERGWSRSSVLHMFRTLSDTHIGLYPLFEFAEEWMKYKANLSSKETPTEILLEIGIRPPVLRLLNTRILVPLTNTCYTCPQLVDIAIEYLLRRQVPITLPDPHARQTHPFLPDHTGTWFLLADDEGRDTVTLQCINLPFRCSSFKEARARALLNTLPGQTPTTHSFHYHTTKWKSIPSILREVDHTMGRTCLDFGLHPGFYMSQTLKDALDWGHALSGKYEQEIAILVFALPDFFPPTLRVKHLEGEEWTHVTQEARRCVPHPAQIRDRTVPEIDSIRRYDFLYGEMVANTEDVFRRRALPSTHTPPKTQLTSKSRKGDLFLQDHLVACLFFQKHMPVPTSVACWKWFPFRSNVLS
jgi:hypothetical protein